jgi:hypothetical protein
LHQYSDIFAVGCKFVLVQTEKTEAILRENAAARFHWADWAIVLGAH